MPALRCSVLALALSLAGCLHSHAGGPSAFGESKAAASAAAPSPSRGCRAGAERGPDGERLLTSGGRTRRYLLRAPPAARSGTPSPLVLNFHGLTETASVHELFTGMTGPALARGMVVVYPAGVGQSWNAGECCGRARKEGVDDVRFVRDLVAQLSRELCIDRRRVYATGMSNGAIFSYRLACEASDLVTAVAPVAGTDAMPECRPRRPVPVLAFNGTSDLLVRYQGDGLFGYYDLRSVPDTFARWKKFNGCAGESAGFKGGDASCVEGQGCRVETRLCTIDGGGHTWPGGAPVFFLGHTSSDLDATATMLDWFATQVR